MKVFFASDNEEPKIEVEAEKTSVKGYKGFEFFVFKHPDRKKWYVCEYTTGGWIGEGTTKQKSKTDARKWLNLNTNGDKMFLESEINIHEKINEVENGKTRQLQGIKICK